MKTKNQKYIPFLATGLFTVAIMLIVYALWGIYPFGNGSVVCDDLVQQYLPRYVSTYDWLHSGNGSMFYNWNTAAGIQSLTSGFYARKPLDFLFLLFVSRENIEPGMSFLLLAKLIFAALSMHLFLRKRFKLNGIWECILSASYAFSGFLILYYSNIAWIDAALIFPMLILAGLHLAETGKILPYVAVLTYFLCLSIYTSYMVFLFLLLVGGLYIIFMQPKENRKITIIRFGFSSVISLLMSAVINLPSVYYLLSSERNSLASASDEEESTLHRILTADNEFYTLRVALFLLCAALLWAFFILLLTGFKKNKKRTLFYLLSVLILVIPGIIESINLIWHVGSYKNFPLRYLYMLIFMLICISATVLTEGLPKIFIEKKKVLSALAITVSVILSVVAIVYTIRRIFIYSDIPTGIVSYRVFKTETIYELFIPFGCLFVAYLLLLLNKHKKISSVIIAISLTAEIFTVLYPCIGCSSQRTGENGAYSLNFIDYCNTIYDNLDLESDNLTKIKDKDMRLNNNYPLMINYPAMSNFTQSASSTLATSMESLGYSQIFTRILDNSGTLLSDALLGIKYAMSEDSLPEEEYTYIKSLDGDYSLYSYNYTLPNALVVGEDFVNIDISENTPFENTNAIYKALGGDGNIIEEDKNNFDCEFYGEYTINIDVEGTKHLYLHLDYPGIGEFNDITDYNIFIILVNGELQDTSYFGGENMEMYPNTYSNNILDMGEFTDESVEILITCISEKIENFDATIGIFDNAKMKTLCENTKNDAVVNAGGRELTASVTAKKGEYLYIPVCTDKGWSLTVNGEKTEIKTCIGSFIAIPLQEGENEIEMKFTPYLMNYGLIISVVALVIFVAYLLIKKKLNLPLDKDNKFLRLFEKVYIVGMCVVYTGLYIVPMALSIYFNYIKK